MATISKRGDRWQVKIRRKGYPTTSKAFSKRNDADAWARQQEAEMDRGVWRDRAVADSTTLQALLDRYLLEVVPNLKSAPIETYRLRRLQADLGRYRLSALSALIVAEWRDRRLKCVAPSTVNRELNSLSAAINWARKDLMIPIENPVSGIRRPKQDPARDRRLIADEEQRLIAALQAEPRRPDGTLGTGTRNPWILPLVQLALETAMRRGELLALEWKHVDIENRTAYLPVTKNGTARKVPLSTEAVTILRRLPGDMKGRVLPTTEAAAKQAWQRCVENARTTYESECTAAGREPDDRVLVDLHFHDLRHEATTRLADWLPKQIDLAAVTGHKDLRMLKRYYHPRAEDLAKMLK